MTIADPPPTVSVVTATYNRSYVLRHALRSVLAQDFADFEVLVVGDACTDDTAEVVASFGDPRVTFVNLPINFGDQSGPNNVGIARARGRYLAFLNHDDIWFPDHLSTLLAWLEATGADMVHSPCAGFFGRDDSWTAGLAATGARPVFDPFRDLAPASTWLVTAELFRKVGVFRPATEMTTVPTQEFLFRVWQRGFVHRIVPSLTVLGIASVSQKNSYLVRESPEHELAARLLFERPSFRSELLERIGGQRQSRMAHARQALRAWLMRPFAWAGIAPPFPAWRHSGGLRRGSEIEHLRKLRGLDRLNQPSDLLGKLRAREIAVGPRYPLGKRVYLGIGGSDFRVKEWGWSFADRDGTWTDGKDATLGFRLEALRQREDLELSMEAVAFAPPRHSRQRVNVVLEGKRLASLEIGSDPTTLMVKIPAARQPRREILRIGLNLPDAVSPNAIGASPDVRQLALFVTSVELRRAAG